MIDDVIAGDVTGDGKRDLLVVTDGFDHGGAGYVFQQDEGGWSADVPAAFSDTPRKPVLSDLDADGDLDLAAFVEVRVDQKPGEYSLSSRFLAVFLNDGSGFQRVGNPISASLPSQTAGELILSAPATSKHDSIVAVAWRPNGIGRVAQEYDLRGGRLVPIGKPVPIPAGAVARTETDLIIVDAGAAKRGKPVILRGQTGGGFAGSTPSPALPGDNFTNAAPSIDVDGDGAGDLAGFSGVWLSSDPARVVATAQDESVDQSAFDVPLVFARQGNTDLVLGTNGYGDDSGNEWVGVDLISRTRGAVEDVKLYSERGAGQGWQLDVTGDGSTDVVFLNNISRREDRLQIWLADDGEFRQARYTR